MPSVKIPKKSTDVDMTPFVDVAFLILTFFIMATKFKPPEAVKIQTPNSVSTNEIEGSDAIMVSIAGDGRAFFSMLAEGNPSLKYDLISNLNSTRNLGLTEDQMKNFQKAYSVGVPFDQLKSFLSLSEEDQNKAIEGGSVKGVPVDDSTGGELFFWVRDANAIFSATGKPVKYFIKGDNKAVYPVFKSVVQAFKKNELFKFNLITMPEGVPSGSELSKYAPPKQ